MDETDIDQFLETENIPYEEEIIKNPCHVKSWLRYIEHQNQISEQSTNILYERALKDIPGSYKLWYSYLSSLRKQASAYNYNHPIYNEVNNAHERGLVFMNKMPRIWVDFCTFLRDQGLITYTRRALDRSLRALAITQHSRIWPIYIEFLLNNDIPETGKRAFRRYLKLCPQDAEIYIDYLVNNGSLDEASKLLAKVVNDDSFVSREGKSNHQLWHELCNLVCKNPGQVTSIKIDPIVRSGINRFRDEKGRLWNSLADYYIRGGHFEKARDIYEEGILNVITVRDFTQIFDAYTQFEESHINNIMENTENRDLSEEEDLDLEMRLARLENLMERRLLLLNSVLLRQNPHNIHEWLKRVKLLEDNKEEIILTYEEALKTVNDSKLTVGRLSDLWVSYATFYENQANQTEARTSSIAAGEDEMDEEGDEDEEPEEPKKIDDKNDPYSQALTKSRAIYQRAVQDTRYVKVDHLAHVWCQWIEMEVRLEKFDTALKLLQRATTAHKGDRQNYYDSSDLPQNRLHKSLKLWSLYADLEESFGSFGSTKAVYDRIIELHIATPQIIINYGMFLEENRYYEEAFKAYEKGVSIFKWPVVYDIWNVYLSKFVERYGGKKLERARDLFEQCLENCPPKYTKSIFLLYAKLEEEHGLARHAMSVYDRATGGVAPQDQFEMYQIYIERAASIFGLPKTRSIYEKAIEVLKNHQAREMCLQFAELECKLGEIDRARAIYAHGSQMADPRANPEYWQAWKEFEVKHGNEETVKEMLRIRRSVQAIYNTQVGFMSAQMMQATQMAEREHISNQNKMDHMKMLEEEVKAAESSQQERPHEIKFVKSKKPIATSDDEEGQEDEGFVQQPVPTEIFGGLVKDE